MERTAKIHFREIARENVPHMTQPSGEEMRTWC
jgi:hypothetical protein